MEVYEKEHAAFLDIKDVLVRPEVWLASCSFENSVKLNIVKYLLLNRMCFLQKTSVKVMRYFSIVLAPGHFKSRKYRAMLSYSYTITSKHFTFCNQMNKKFW